MDRSKVDALLHWVQLLLDEKEVEKRLLSDVKVIWDVLKLVDKELCFEKFIEDDAGILGCIFSYLEGIYDDLQNAISRDAIEAGNEFETVKLLVLVMVVAVNSDVAPHFLEPIMRLSKIDQINIMRTLSPLNDTVAEKDLHILLKEVLCSAVNEEESQFVTSPSSFIFSPGISTHSPYPSFIASPAFSHIRNNSNSSSIGADSAFKFMASPGASSKRELFEKNKINIRMRRLESNVTTQNHMIDELEYKLEAARKKNEMLESENAKLKNHVKSLSMVQDEIESMKMVKIQLDTKEIEFERINKRCIEALEENSVLRTEMSMAMERSEAEKEEIRMKLKVVKEKCGQLQSSETSLKVENAELINSMKVQKDEYQRSLEDKIQECKELLDHVAYLKEKLAAQERLKNNDESFMTLSDDKQCLQNEIRIVTLESELKKVTDELKSVQELENVRSELEIAMGAIAVAKDLQAKREEELSELKCNIEEETKRHEMAVKQLCSKHSNVVEELNLQLDSMKRAQAFLEKKNRALEDENAELAQELQRVTSLKSDIERKTKNVEQQLNEANLARVSSEESIQQFEAQVARASRDIDELKVQLQEVEAKFSTTERAKSSLDMQLSEVKDKLQEETSQKLGLNTKLREVEEEMNGLRKQLEEEENKRDAAQKEVHILQFQLEQLKNSVDERQIVLEDAEAAKKKLEQVVEGLLQREEDLLAESSRLERSKKLLEEELEKAHSELEISVGAAAVTNDLQAKREEELSDLKRNIEEETKRHEMAMKQLCSKHSGVVEELNLQLDTMKKAQTLLEKNNKIHEDENAELAQELQRVTSLKSDIERKAKNVEQQLNEANMARVSSEESIQRFETQVARASTQIDDLKVQLQEVETKLSTTERVKSSLDIQLSDVQDKLQEESSQKLDLNKKLKEVEEELNRLQKQVEEEENEKDAAQKEVHLLQSQLEQLKKRVDERQIVLEDTEAAKKKLEQEVEGLLQREEDLLAENSQLERSRKLQEEAQTILEKNNKILEVKNAELAQELQRVTSLKSDIERKAKNVEQQLNEANMARVSSEESIQRFEAQVARASSEIYDLKVQLQEVEARLLTTERSKSSLGKQLNEVQNQFQEETSQTQSLNTKLKEVEEKINGLQEQLEEEENMKDAAQKEVLILQSQLEQLKKSVDERQVVLEDTEAAKKKLEQEVEGLLQREADLLAENSQLEKLQEEAQTFLEKNNKIHEDENAELAQELQRVTSLKSDIERKAKNVEQQLNEANMARVSSEESIQRFETQVARASTQIDDLKVQLQEVEAKLSTTERAKSSLDIQLSEVQDKLQEESSQKLDLNTKLKEVEEELNRLQKQVEEEENEKDAAQKEVHLLQSQLEQLRKSVDERQIVLEDTEAAKKKLEQEVEGLLQREEDLLAENSQLERSRKLQEEAQTFLEKNNKILEDDNAELTQELKEANLARVSSEESIQQFEAQVARASRDIDDLNVQLEEVEAKLSTTERAKSSLDMQLSEVKDKLQEETSQKLGLNTKLREALEEINGLREQLEEEENKRDAARKQVQLFQSQFDPLKKSADERQIVLEDDEAAKKLEQDVDGLLQRQLNCAASMKRRNDKSSQTDSMHQIIEIKPSSTTEHVRDGSKQRDIAKLSRTVLSSDPVNRGEALDISFEEQSTLVCDDLAVKKSPGVKSLHVIEENAFGGSIASLQSVTSIDSNISYARGTRRQSGLIGGPARRRSLLYMAGKTPPERRTTLSSVGIPCVPACQMEDEPDILESKGLNEELCRMNELKRRNTLCLPHLKSSYPLEVIATESSKNVQDPEYEASVRNSFHQVKKRKSEERENALPPKRNSNTSNFSWKKDGTGRAVKSDSSIAMRSTIKEESKMTWGLQIKEDEFETSVDPRRESIAFSIGFDEPNKKLKPQGSLRRSRGSAHLVTVASKESISSLKENLPSKMVVSKRESRIRQSHVPSKGRAADGKIHRSETPLKQSGNKTTLKSRTNNIRKSLRKSMSKVRGTKQ